MIKDLEVTIIQTSLAWEDIDANLSAFSQKLESSEAPSTDLIVLPEMFSTGYTMNASAVAETMTGKTMEWMAKAAAHNKAVITGSCVIKEKGKYYNRLIWMRPDGTYEFYDKRHTFRMAEENKTYASGEKKLIVELQGWRDLSPGLL
jgi:omega-amidase